MRMHASVCACLRARKVILDPATQREDREPVSRKQKQDPALRPVGAALVSRLQHLIRAICFPQAPGA